MYLETKKGVDKYMSKNIIGLFSKSKMKLEKKNNKFTGRYVENMREVYIDDDTKIILLRHFDENAHPIGNGYIGPINHYNIVLHKRGSNGRWEKVINAHIVKDLKTLEWVLLITEYE